MSIIYIYFQDIILHLATAVEIVPESYLFGQVAPFSLYKALRTLTDTTGYILQLHGAISKLGKHLQNSASILYGTVFLPVLVFGAYTRDSTQYEITSQTRLRPFRDSLEEERGLAKSIKGL